jgi:peptide/nickel transport system permease protein
MVTATAPATKAAAASEAGASTPRRGVLRTNVVLILRILAANPLTLVGFILVVLVCGAALLVVAVPAVSMLVLGHSVSILPYPALDVGAFSTFQSPTLAHPFGTDQSGADVFSNVLTALPTDLGIGFGVAGVSLIIGTLLGLVAGFYDTPGTLSAAGSVGILRLTDIFLSFPTLVLALAITAAWGRGEIQSELAVIVTWWPFYVRLVRGEVLSIKVQPYVIAARAAGVPESRILFRHVVRNLLEPLAVYFSLDVGTVIVTYSTISYVGVGVPPSLPEWGNLMYAYQDYLVSAPWTVLSVTAAIFITVLAFSLLGDGLRDILDPRSRRIMSTTAAASRTLSTTGTGASGGEGP